MRTRKVCKIMEVKINYKSIYDIIKQQILEEAFPNGSMLPTEQNLAYKYSVSRPTIAKAYNQLQSEGYLVKKKGLGSMVTHKANNRIHSFGLLLPGAGESEIFSIINDQFQKRSEDGEFNCLWEGATASDADIRKNRIETCCDNYIKSNVDGIFFAPLERVPRANEINYEICKKITDAGIPLILIDRDIEKAPARSNYDVVGIDNFNAGCIMGQHMIDAGCEKIFFFYRPNSAWSVNLRIAGIRNIVLDNNLRFDFNNIYCGDPDNIEFVKKIKFIKGKTGIICANDSTAAVLMSTLDATGIKISSDVLICGYDNMKYSTHLKCSLTSFEQPCVEIADVSIDLMNRRLKDKKAIPVTVNLAGTIIPRESSVFVR